MSEFNSDGDTESVVKDGKTRVVVEAPEDLSCTGDCDSEGVKTGAVNIGDVSTGAEMTEEVVTAEVAEA